MLLYYTVPQALRHLKYRIECYEKRILKEKSPFKKKEYEDIIEWYFERGLNIINLTKEIEKQKELTEYFITHGKPNPETTSINNILNNKSQQ